MLNTIWREKWRCVAISLVFCCVVGIAFAAQVTTGADSGNGSFRHVVENAGDGETVTISSGVSEIVLNKDEGVQISYTKTIDIRGNVDDALNLQARLEGVVDTAQADPTNTGGVVAAIDTVKNTAYTGLTRLTDNSSPSSPGAEGTLYYAGNMSSLSNMYIHDIAHDKRPSHVIPATIVWSVASSSDYLQNFENVFFVDNTIVDGAIVNMAGASQLTITNSGFIGNTVKTSQVTSG